jgi:hypothetical protein
MAGFPDELQTPLRFTESINYEHPPIKTETERTRRDVGRVEDTDGDRVRIANTFRTGGRDDLRGGLKGVETRRDTRASSRSWVIMRFGKKGTKNGEENLCPASA